MKIALAAIILLLAAAVEADLLLIPFRQTREKIQAIINTRGTNKMTFEMIYGFGTVKTVNVYANGVLSVTLTNFPTAPAAFKVDAQ